MKKPRVALPTAAANASAATALYAGQFYPCGSSISAADRAATGAMGCLVQKDGDIYGLTNNHVTGNYSHTVPGMPTLDEIRRKLKTLPNDPDLSDAYFA